MIDLTIMTLDSHNHTFRVPVTFTILELKEFIAAQVNVEVVQQRLIFCGRVLSNETKLADIGINGKVMHLVKKVSSLTTTTSGSSSTTTNSTSRSGQNAGLGSRGFNTHNPTNSIGTNGIPTAGELPHVLRNRGICSRDSVAFDMIRRGNEVLNSLEYLLPNPRQSSASNAERAYPEGLQQAEVSYVPAGGSTNNKSSAEQASGTLPSSASSEQHIRNDRQTSENRSTVPENERQYFLKLSDELNKLNDRLQPFNAMYRQLIIDDPRFDTTEGEDGSLRAQSIFDGVSAVMHFMSHAYHLISDMRIPYNTAPPRSVYARRAFQQSTVLRAANTVTTITTGAPPSTQQSTSTQTTTTSQSIPSIQTVRLGRGDGSETLRTTDSSSTTNPPSQGLARGLASNPHRDPFLPCGSHHFEPDIRPFLRAARLNEGTN